VYALKNVDLSPAATHDKAGEDPAHDHGHQHGHEDGKTQDGHEAEQAEQAELAGVPAVPPEEHSEGGPPADTDPAEDHAHPVAHDGHAHKAAHGDEPAEPAGDSTVGEHPGITPPATEDERNALRELAEIHASRGDLEKAVYPLRKLLSEPTREPALLSLAANVFLGTGHYREALTTSRKALRHAGPGRVDLKVVSVLARFRLGEMAEAIHEAEAAVKEHPKDVDLLTALGTMEIEMGPAHPTYGEALEQALKLKPEHIPALYQAGRKAQLEGDFRDAEKVFLKVVRLDPKHAKALGQLGMARFHLRKHDQAGKDYESALALNPKDYNTWFNLGELRLIQAGQEKKADRIRALRAKAMEGYLRAVELNPDHAEAHYRAGVLLNGNGQYKEAIRHLEASRKADSRHVPTLVQLAVAYEGLKDPVRAKEYLEKALELDPEDKIVLFKLHLLGAQSG
jgi:tetratricopeptide (TPR) repeat protein